MFVFKFIVVPMYHFVFWSVTLYLLYKLGSNSIFYSRHLLFLHIWKLKFWVSMNTAGKPVFFLISSEGSGLLFSEPVGKAGYFVGAGGETGIFQTRVQRLTFEPMQLFFISKLLRLSRIECTACKCTINIIAVIMHECSFRFTFHMQQHRR